MSDQTQKRHVVITVHGIRTYGRWQERLQRILASDARWQPGDEILIYRYGFFTLFSFMIPFLRNLAVKQFRDYLESVFEIRRPDRVDIVAHSFGTYLAIEALASCKIAAGVGIHTAILCGSALPPNRNLSRLLGPERPIGRIVNECGTRDGVLLLTLAIFGVGMAGRLGLQGFEGRTLRNRYHRLGHSGYFEQNGRRPYDGFMRRWWLPLLLDTEPARERDRRPDNPPFSDRFWRLLGENAGPFTVSVYVGILGALVLTFASLWFDAVAQREVAVANESYALTALSRVATENHRYTDAVKLALAAWPRKDRGAIMRPIIIYRPRLESTLQALSLAVGGDPGLTRQMRHAGPVTGAILLDDDRRILSWSDDGTLRLWDAANGLPIGRAMKHDGAVKGALLTGNGRRVLSWSGRELRLWEATTGDEVGAAIKHEHGSVDGAFLIKGEQHILSFGGGELRLSDAATGQKIRATIKPEYRWSKGARLTKDARRIVSWSLEELRLWDVTTGEQVGPTTLHDLTPDECKGRGYYTMALLGCPFDDVEGALLAEDQRRIISWGGNELRLGDVTTGEQIGPIMKHEHGLVGGALLTKDARRILSWGGGELRLWDAATAQPIGHPMTHHAVSGARLIEGERRVLSWSADGSLRLWDAATGDASGPVMYHRGEVVKGALLTRDERRILSWGGNALRLWDAATGEPIGPTIAHTGVTGALLTGHQRRVVSWSTDGSLRLRDVTTGQQIDPFIKQPGVHGALLTADERRVLSWSADGTLRLRDMTTGEHIGPAMKHERTVRGARLTRDGRRILSWDRGELRLWDAVTGEQVTPAMKHPLDRRKPEDKLSQMMQETQEDDEDVEMIGEVRGALLTKDERRIFSWTAEGTVRVWDATTGQQIGSPIEAEIEGAHPSKDGQRIVSWSAGTVWLWDAATGEPIGPGTEHDRPVADAVLTADERRIVSWAGKELRLLDAATHEQIGPAMNASAAGAVPTRDALRILSWDAGAVRLWDTATGQQIGPAMPHPGAKGALLTMDERRVLSFGGDALRLWDIGWPGGNLLDVACALLPDHELADLSKRYGILLTEPICATVASLTWSKITRAPAE